MGIIKGTDGRGIARGLAAIVLPLLVALGIFATPARASSPPEATAAFADAQIPRGATTTLSITIGNPNRDVALTGVWFIAQLPRQVKFADDVNLANSCGGKVDFPYAGSVRLTGGTVERDQLCEISFDVTATWSGEGSTAVEVDSDEGDSTQTTASVTVAPPAASARVYWSYGPVSYANLDGSGGGDLPVGGASAGAGNGVALDPAAGRVYWANPSENKISYENLDGSGGGDLDTASATVSLPAGVALDHADGRIYWANYAANQISYANLNGTGGGELNTGSATVDGPWGVAVDPGSGRIYWANALGSETISYANLDGSGGQNVPTNGATVSNPAGLALDLAHGRIYWTNQGTPAVGGQPASGGSIDYANLDGSGGGNVPLPVSMTSNPAGVSVDPDTGRIYWADWDTSTIYDANLDGSDPHEVATIGQGTAAFPALLKPPAAASAPTINGGSAPGAALTCSAGVWESDVPASFYYLAPQRLKYHWSRDGTAIAGATQPQLTATTPGSYSCTVTATNAAGSTSSESAAHRVETLPVQVGTGTPGSGRSGASTEPVCRITAASNRVILARRQRRQRTSHRPGTLRFVVRCTQTAKLTLSGKVIATLSSKHRHRRARTRALVLRPVRGVARADITLVLTIELPARALMRLTHGYRETLAVKLTAANVNGSDDATVRIRRLKPVWAAAS